MRTIAKVYSDKFYGHNAFQKKLRMHGSCNKMVLLMDGDACNITFRTFSLLHGNGIIVAGLPTDTSGLPTDKSHVLNPIYVGVFGPF